MEWKKWSDAPDNGLRDHFKTYLMDSRSEYPGSGLDSQAKAAAVVREQHQLIYTHCTTTTT